MSVEGELRNVHTAVTALSTDLGSKIDEVKDNVAALAREVTQVATDGVRTREEFEKHVDGHEVVAARRWSVFTEVAAGVILIVAGILIAGLTSLI